MASFSRLKNEVASKEQHRRYYEDNFAGLNAYERHRKFLSNYVHFYGSLRPAPLPGSAPVKTDYDVLRENYRFLRSEKDDAVGTWEQRLAKRYHDKLFKEYCVADLSCYKESKVGMRWRTEKEVVEGKGQFICGEKGCSQTGGLHSFEVNFGYTEAGEKKQALVKLRVCPKHASQLNYKQDQKMRRQRKEEERGRRKRARGEAEVSGRNNEHGGGLPRKEEECEEEKGNMRGTEGACADGGVEHGENEGGFLHGEGAEEDRRREERGWRAERVASGRPEKEEEFDEYFSDLLS